MKKGIKIGLIIGTPALALLLLYFITPYKSWEKYKADHPSLFDDPNRIKTTYLEFCQAYWKTFFLFVQDKEEDITYDGGELDEIVITPQNNG